MKNSKDGLQDFLKDEHFVHWVLHPDAKADAYWRNWMEKHPDKLKEIKLAREIILSFQYQHNYSLPADTYAGMLDTITSHHRRERLHQKKGRQWLIRAAASLLLLLLGTVTVWYISIYKKEEDKQPVAWMVKQAKKGEKLTVKLSDGTKVKLNANSILVYPAVFDQKGRYVKLEGEAFFDVAKDSDRAFSITSGHVRTTVLGTSFNVRAYEEEPGVAVAVVTGNVGVKGEGAAEVFLSPNEVSYYHKEDSIISTARQDVSDMIAWSRNILIFDEDSEEEVWSKLENWYGVNIIVQNKRSIEGKYSGRYHNESLERVLDGISYAAEFEYEILENKNVIIK